MTLTVPGLPASAQQQQLVFDKKTVYVNLGSSLSTVMPGKTWISGDRPRRQFFDAGHRHHPEQLRADGRQSGRPAPPAQGEQLDGRLARSLDLRWRSGTGLHGDAVEQGAEQHGRPRPPFAHDRDRVRGRWVDQGDRDPDHDERRAASFSTRTPTSCTRTMERRSPSPSRRPARWSRLRSTAPPAGTTPTTTPPASSSAAESPGSG